MKQLALIFIFGMSPLRAQEKPLAKDHLERERSYHVVHYRLNIEINEKEKTCEGDVSITFVPLRAQFDQLRLDAAEMKITHARLESKKLNYELRGESLFVDLDKVYGLDDTLTLTVSYAISSPRKGLFFIRPDSGYPNKQWQVWSNGESEDNHYFFPCYDFPNDKATSEMIVTVNEKWTAISNGKLLEVKRDPHRHTATYHWYENKPHVSYLISLVAGEYVEVKDSSDHVSLSYFVYKHQRDDALRSFGKTPKIMEFFSNKIGYPYPWEKYAQTVVQDYVLGGEENVSATTLTDGTIHDERAHLDYSSDGLVAHEFSHQWWGDMLTCRDWSHAWLNEGFASYFDVLFQEYDKGIDVALKSIYDAQRNVVNTDKGDKRRATVSSHYVNPNDIFDIRIYGKGACVLHMLRFILGDELFWKAINYYAHRFAYQCVETNDFKVAIQEATGYNLGWFFDEWLYKPGYPEFEVKTSWDQGTRMVNVSVKQVQKVDSLTGIFTTPVEIEVWVNGEPQTYLVMITKQEEEFSFPAYQEPQLVLFDKGSRILKKVKNEPSLDGWIFQLEHASHGVDRIAAVDELRWIVDSSKVMQAISRAAINDPFFEVRREAVWALGDAKVTDVAETLVMAYGDYDARVRTAAATSLKNSHGEHVIKTLQHAFEKDSSYAVAAAALGSLAKVDSMNTKNYCKMGLLRDSFREGIRIAALRALSQVGDEDAFTMIKNYTAYGVDRNVRIESLWMLYRGWKQREGMAQFFIDMLDDPSFHVKRTVINILGTLGNALAIEPLQHIVDSGAESRIVKDALDAIARIQEAQQHDAH